MKNITFVRGNFAQKYLMKSLFTLLSFGLAFFSQTQILKKTYYDYQRSKPEYVYYVNSLGQYNGLLTQYSDEGAKLGEWTWVNGIKNGPSKEYYIHGPASKLKRTGTFKNDQKHGQWITYTYVKYGQSYFDIMQTFAFNDKQDDIFNTGIQTKHSEEFFEDGQIKKEINYYPSGKTAHIKHFLNGIVSGEYIAYTIDNQQVIKGVINNQGKMIGTWIIPRENNGDCPKDKSDFSKVTYTQKIKFDDYGNIDTNYFSKTYYLSGKLRDSVKVLKIKYQGEYDHKGIWYLCGPNTFITGPYQSFHESGKTQTQGQYTVENGKSVKSGIWKTYDESGNLVNEINEDEIRIKAVEAKKEAERIEKEKIEKERIAKEEKIAKENREKEELAVLIEKADSSIIKVNALFNNFENLVQKKYSSAPPLAKYTVVNTGYSYVYVVNKKPELYFHFDQIQNSFKEKVEKLKKKDTEILRKVEDAKFYNKTVDFNLVTERNNIYSEIVLLGQKHMKLNMKMIDLAEIKTKNIERQLETSNTVEEKIKILENYEFEPK